MSRIRSAHRWQAFCAAGALDDFCLTRHRSGTPAALPRYRLKGTSTVWSSETMPLAPDHWIGVAGVSGDSGKATVIFVSNSVSMTTLQRLQSLGAAYPLYGMKVNGPLGAIPDNPEPFDATVHNAALWFIKKPE